MVHSREAYTTLDMIGDVGGLFDGLMLIVSFIIGNLISHNMLVQIAYKMYDVKSKHLKLKAKTK